MKHIKTYESLDSIEYKEWIVLLENNILFVYHVLEQYPDDDTFILRLIAKYKNNEVFYITDNVHANADEIEKELVYQSNNSQDVLDMLPTLSKSTKYNI